MKAIAIALLLCISFRGFGQVIVIPDGFETPAGLEEAITTIAGQMIPYIQDKKEADLFYYRALMELGAKKYNKVLISIDSMQWAERDDKWEGTPADAINLEAFALTKIEQSASRQTFDETFAKTFLSLYTRLPEKAKSFAGAFFLTDSADTRRGLDAQLVKLKDRDSLNTDEARQLIIAYLRWYVNIKTAVIANRIMETETRKKFIILDSVLIKMKDGAQLSAVIIRSRDSIQPLPVVMMYNIYAGSRDLSQAQEIASKGYVGIILNTRGKKLSPQAIEPFEHDGQDVYEAIDWISRQPWCNGKVGMFGGSYLGFSQWSATKKLHPALKTIVPQVAVGIGIDYPQMNGVFMGYMLRWIHYVSNNKLIDQSDFRNGNYWDSLYFKWYRSGRSFRALDTLEGRPNALFQRWLDHPAYDAYWQNMIPYADEFAHINIPVLTTTGYFDDDQRGAFYYMQQHLERNRHAEHYLLIGPWDHGGAQSFAREEVGNYAIDSVALINVNKTVYEWFDHVLKGRPMPAMLKDKVNFEVAGANEWRSAASLKKASNDSLVFYLANTKARDGYKLTAQQQRPVGSIVQEISYTDRRYDIPADATDIAVLDTVINPGESLVFISDSLKQDMVMNGSFEGNMDVTINKKDVDLFIVLYQLMPDGKYFTLGRYWGRASYAKDRSKRQLLHPGKKESIAFDNSYYMCRKLSKGSRIVAQVGILKTPAWQLNYGTGKPVSDETIADGAVPLNIEWHNSSRLKIPLLR